MHVLSLTAWLTAFLVALVTGMTASRPHAPHTRLTLRLTLRPCSACQQDQCAGAIRLREGQRVVRGPDWKWGRQDGPDEVSPPSSLCCYLLFPLFVVVAFRAALPSLPADPSCFFFPGCVAAAPLIRSLAKVRRADLTSRVMGRVSWVSWLELTRAGWDPGRFRGRHRVGWLWRSREQAGARCDGPPGSRRPIELVQREVRACVSSSLFVPTNARSLLCAAACSSSPLFALLARC